MTAPALDIRDASVPGRLEGVTTRVRRGVIAGLIGPNGSGKSSLLQVAAGLLQGSSKVMWDGRSLESIPALERGRMATWVPQEARFEFGFSVRSVVAQGRFAHGDDDKGVDETLAKLDLVSLAHRPVNELSGGERQRVILARALATAAPLQLWDEPLAPLDVRHALEVMLIARELADAGASVVISLHDLRMAHCLDEVLVMHERKLQAAGPPDVVLTPELLLTVFGVRARTAPGLTLELP